MYHRAGHALESAAATNLPWHAWHAFLAPLAAKGSTRMYVLSNPTREREYVSMPATGEPVND